MLKKVLLVGYDQRFNYGQAEDIMKSVLKCGDIPIFAVSLYGTIRESTVKNIAAANQALVEDCDRVIVNNDYSRCAEAFAFSDLIGYAVLYGKDIYLSNGAKGKLRSLSRTPAEALKAAMGESTITDATED